MITLLLRPNGGPLHVQVDAAAERVVDVRGELGAAPGAAAYLFTGAYVVEPEFVERIPEGKIVSMTPLLVEMLRRGETIAALVDSGGAWAEVGDRTAYLGVHRAIASGALRLRDSERDGWPGAIHPGARISQGARLAGVCSVGPRATIGEGAVVEDSVLWEGAEIASGSRLTRCIVRDHRAAAGTHVDADL